MIIINDFVPNICSKISGMNITAVTLFFWIFIRPEYADNSVIIRHEKIHVEQYKETLLLGFFLFYFYDFVKNMIKERSWSVSYRNIRLEKEAYQYQNSEGYIKRRKKFSWWNL